MAEFKTPGVYVQEISTLPASVASVLTAIPAFVGYTEKREKNGEDIPLNTPVRITSLLEYQEIFGGAYSEDITVTLTGPGVSEEETTIAIDTPGGLSPYELYYHMVMYFANGGGPCYVVPVGTYTTLALPGDPNELITEAELLGGLLKVEEEDEVTMLVVPEAIRLDTALQKNVNDSMLAQCNKLQDRVAIMDMRQLGGTVFDDAADFRDNAVGLSNLKYGASYYPSLISSTKLKYDYAETDIVDNRTNAVFDGSTLDVVLNGITGASATGTVTIVDFNAIANAIITVDGTPLEAGVDWTADVGNDETAESLATAIDGLADVSATSAGNVVVITADVSGTTGNSITLATTHSTNAAISGGTFTGGMNETLADKTLANNIIDKIKKKYKVKLYPSATMAGIYARVDRNRGVWKAPANVSVNNVKEPALLVTAEEQGGLNIDATSGKSINVIRVFAGKGTLVWGARTLAGNDNEWRYVPVRRFYNFVEESVKKASEFVVFEPNEAKTWIRVKTMIENFLSKLWRDGALAGATTQDAFFVKVGLGQTMTALDILEGRLNIEIGMAVVRPAEFIILKFSHKLQES